MPSSLFRSLFLSGFLALGTAAHASIIFSDDFSANTPGLNSTPLGWTIANTGTVDILGECNSTTFDDLLPGNNCYIDLNGDGGTSIGGSVGLLTKSLFLPSGHAYTASFDLAGNNVNPFTDTVTISLGTSVRSITVNPFDDFTTYSIHFSPSVSSVYNLSFINSNLDYYGALLDNVSVEQVPGPLPLLGAGVAWGFSRRLRARCRKGQP